MLKYLLKKEFKQILRNRFVPVMIFMFPLMVLLIFPWAANYEIKNLNVTIVDNDHSAMSRRCIENIVSSNYFRFENYSVTFNSAMHSIEKGKVDVIIEIPHNFEKNIMNHVSQKIMISADAVNGMKAGMSVTFLSNIIFEFNNIIISELFPEARQMTSSLIEINPQYRFNKNLNYQVYMVPALMVMILTLLSGFLPGASIVMEKESGTMEQINVTPVPKFTFVLAKLIPFWIAGFIAISVGFLVAWLDYGLIPVGHFWTIYIFAAVYILAISGFGLVISNYAQSMQQAFFIIFFFMMLFIMLSGLYTPINSMPEWAKWIATFNPLKYLMLVMRSVYLKGSEIGQVLNELYVLIGFAVFFNGWAVMSYRKNS